MHKYLILTGLLIFSSYLIAQSPIRRQNKPTQTEETRESGTIDEPSGFKDKLWFGGSFILSLGSFNGSSTFNFGLAPMVGYKITPDFSIGPRVELLYTYYKTIAFNRTYKFNLFSAGLGPFARYKFFDVIFVHAEYQLEFLQQPIIDQNLNPLKITGTNSNFYAGLGYNAGGGEILVLYNFLSDQNSLSVPFSFRVGFTYKF